MNTIKTDELIVEIVMKWPTFDKCGLYAQLAGDLYLTQKEIKLYEYLQGELTVGEYLDWQKKNNIRFSV